MKLTLLFLLSLTLALGQSFGQRDLSTSDITKVVLLGREILLTGDQMNGRYVHIWEMEEALKAKAVAIPRSSREVSIICSICHEHHQPVVVHGGLTGLVGGTRVLPRDLVISLECLNEIEEVDEMSRTMTVQAGVILERIHQEAEKRNLFFPLNFGAKGSAQIGGCISTNAGGLRVLKYGMTRNLVLGLETVLPDGTIINSLKKIVKDNAGYALSQIFIGSEGTLGIVTKAVLKLEESPLSRNSAFIGINGFRNVVEFLKYSDARLSGQLSGFEILWGDTFHALTSPPSTNSPPLKHGFEFYVLLETLGSDWQYDRKILESALEKAMQLKLFSDAVVAYSSSDMTLFWNIRENVGMFNNLSPFQQHFDISIPIHAIGDYVDSVKMILEKESSIRHVYAFGHLADGNIHFIIGKDLDNEELKLKDR